MKPLFRLFFRIQVSFLEIDRPHIFLRPFFYNFWGVVLASFTVSSGIPLNSDALEVLRQQIGKNHTRIFTYNGNPVDKVSTKVWKKALKRAVIENFRWHDLRHTWASWHVQNGTPLNVLQELGVGRVMRWFKNTLISRRNIWQNMPIM